MTVKKFVADSDATSHMVNFEENMANLKDAKTRVTVGDIITLTGTDRDGWHGWQRRDVKLYHVRLTNMDIISGLHENTFTVTRALQNITK